MKSDDRHEDLLVEKLTKGGQYCLHVDGSLCKLCMTVRTTTSVKRKLFHAPLSNPQVKIF